LLALVALDYARVCDCWTVVIVQEARVVHELTRLCRGGAVVVRATTLLNRLTRCFAKVLLWLLLLPCRLLIAAASRLDTPSRGLFPANKVCMNIILLVWKSLLGLIQRIKRCRIVTLPMLLNLLQPTRVLKHFERRLSIMLSGARCNLVLTQVQLLGFMHY
jgi:glycosylphosphatidylinositol transamidase (GPIT) subunit GPI8